MSDPEDFLADSFPELTQRYVAVAIGDHRQLYTHPATGIQLSPPDTLAKNWQLHANSIWAASIFLADHLHEIGLEDLPRNARVLELGAGAGLPGIAIAKATPDAQVWLSDYPDDNILRRLQDNAVRNQLESRCRVVGHIWGSRDLAWPSEPLDSFDELANSFDLIIAADTLWNVDSQELFIQSLLTFLKRPDSQSPGVPRALLVAGLHTGRYALQKFMQHAEEASLEVVDLRERRVLGNEERP